MRKSRAIRNTPFWRMFYKYAMILTALVGGVSFVVMVISIITQAWNIALIGLLMSASMLCFTLGASFRLGLLGAEETGKVQELRGRSNYCMALGSLLLFFANLYLMLGY